jgi:L-ascorbate metabolism protein UlaG (beta-lactamase superfamily)
MEIKWHGESTFTLKGKSTTIAINPIEGGKHNLKETKADTILLTDDYHEKAKLIKGCEKAQIINWPGEYEVQGAAIISIPAFTNEQEEGDSDKGRVLIFSFLIDDIRICHLGEIGQTLDEDILEKIGDVDLLIVPVACKRALDNKKIHNVIEEIEPRIVIPMFYDNDEDLEKFLKEVGVAEHEVVESYEIKSKSALPEDRTDFVVLKAV